jgi:hypothetical protein
MIRNFKALGLALVAVFAMSAVVASAAQANQFSSAGNVSVAISAAQSTTHKFTVDGSSVTCTTATFASTGEVSSPSKTVKVHPTYSGCTAFGFVGATVTTTGCDYILAVGTKITENVSYNGSIELTCETGKKITISAGGVCEATVSGPQTFTGITYTNESGKVTAAANVTGIKTVKTKDGFGCPFSGTGEVNASYTGNTLASGKHGTEAVAIQVEGSE